MKTGWIVLTTCLFMATAAQGADDNRTTSTEVGLDPTNIATMIEKSMACGGPWIANYFDEAKAIKATGQAQRVGDTLKIGELSFRDYKQPGFDRTAVFNYVGAYRGLEADLIYVQYWEAYGFIVVDRRSGTAIEVPGPPVPSEDGRLFFGASQDEQYDPRADIVERGKFGWDTAAVFSETVSEVCDIRWKGEQLSFRSLKPGKASPPWTPENDQNWGTVKASAPHGLWELQPQFE